MVYALTLNVNVVLGGRCDSISGMVVELIVEFDVPLPLNRSSYTMITPFGIDGGLHDTVSCVTDVVADRLDTGPGTVKPCKSFGNTLKLKKKTSLDFTHHPEKSPQSVLDHCMVLYLHY